jgi:5'-nucleotidase
MSHELSEAIGLPLPERGIYCNRTINLRSIQAIGFDMDYTLIHYRPEEWERRAYEYLQQRLLDRGWPVGALQFDAASVMLGLVVDLELGNIVKANRFGYVKKAMHGTRVLSFEEQRDAYARVLVDLSEPRWVFLNTLFGLSEGCMFAQTVDLLDAGLIEEVLGYADLYKIVRSCLDETHMEGKLKAEIVADPERYAEPDPELPLALLDLKHAGKKLLLITNSEWAYTRAMMSWAFDRWLPAGMTWRELFDVLIVSAGKPDFFSARHPVFEVVDEDGLLRPAHRIREGGAYLGGHAGMVEECLGVPGEDILFVGDHIFADVHVSKSMLRWRTALVVRALEDEMRALETFKPGQAALSEMMEEKNLLEHRYSIMRVALQRLEKGYGPRPEVPAEALRQGIQEVRARLLALDARIMPLAREAGGLSNPVWGLLMRAGNDKSHLARQIERYADIYMSRVSNLLLYTPFVYLRSPRGSLPHDSGPEGGA